MRYKICFKYYINKKGYFCFQFVVNKYNQHRNILVSNPRKLIKTFLYMNNNMSARELMPNQNYSQDKFNLKQNALNSSFNLPIMSHQMKKRSSFIIKAKNIKNKSKESFQNQLSSITDFDTYIQKQYSKMLQQKSQNPTLMIPSGFDKFIHSKLFQNLIKAIYEYMDILIEYQKKYQNLNKLTNTFQYLQRYQPGLKKMRFQTNHLQQKCKQISYVYMGILLSHGQSKMIFKDQYFFETMIYFIAQILKSIFQQENYALIQEELNRIFRTNAFNLIKRRHNQDEINRKYPSLKQVKYDSSTFGVSRMIKRLSIQKSFNYSVQMKPLNSQRIKKPIQIQLSPFGSVQSRSPLISSFYPSSKQKLYQFGKQTRQKQSFIKQARVSNSFFYRKQNHLF